MDAHMQPRMRTNAAQVIGNNMRSGGELKPIVPGQKVNAIFGFCDIRQFTDTTEVLQQEVMEFVNTIARIVDMEVSLHGGAPNKNIGDAFLLVWKLPEGLLQRGSSGTLPPAQVRVTGLRPGGSRPPARGLGWEGLGGVCFHVAEQERNCGIHVTSLVRLIGWTVKGVSLIWMLMHSLLSCVLWHLSGHVATSTMHARLFLVMHSECMHSVYRA